MLRFKVKHKLLVIWLGSIVLTLSVMAGLFEYQIAGLHQDEARKAIAFAIKTLHEDLELSAGRIRQSTQHLSARTDLVASMNMIDRYQDPQDYQQRVFDGEKAKIARELSHHANATGADINALYDSKHILTAFFLSPMAGGQGAGFVTYENGVPAAMLQQADGTFAKTSDEVFFDALRELTPLNTARENEVTLSHKDGNLLVLSASSPIQRKRATGQIRTVGSLVVGRVLGESFTLNISRATGMDFRIHSPDHAFPTAPMDEVIEQVLHSDVPKLTLDGDRELDRSPDHAWVSGENHFVGAVRMTVRTGEPLYFIFAREKDVLQSTLQAFQNTIIVVLAITGLSILPIGVLVLRHTITRPVENLLECADNLRRGKKHDMKGFTGTDEFSELAQSFQIMSNAVRARENALSESQKSLKNAQRIAHIGNWEWNISSGIVRYSDEIHAILGRPSHQLGQSFENFLHYVHADDMYALKRRISETIESGDKFMMEHRIVLPDGVQRFVIHRGERRINADGVTKISATLQDITERHLLDVTKSELVSTVSHELRTPLTSISGVLGLVVGGALGALPADVMKLLNTADKNAKRLALLIDDLLDIEKFSSNTMTFESQPLAIEDMLTQALEANRSFADAHDVRLSIEGDIPKARIFADPARMAQVMANLLSNACKFSAPGDTVSVHAGLNEKGVFICVSDTGPGIPESFHPHVFERFAQADQSLTRLNQKGGTGLGLAICKAIVEKCDGEISFTSVSEPAPCHGVTFTFTLPEWRETGTVLPFSS